MFTSVIIMCTGNPSERSSRGSEGKQNLCNIATIKATLLGHIVNGIVLANVCITIMCHLRVLCSVLC